MKICTIFTGGTIGSRLNTAGTISVDANAPYHLIKMFEEQYNKDITFVTKEPYCILSENLDTTRLMSLIQCVNDTLQDTSLEGIIITHGTDTLQYSAALLDYIFGSSRIPIILVSSDFILTDKRANGLTNFYYATRFIEETKSRGVYVSYKNANGIPCIHRGTRLSSPYLLSADLNSVKNSYVAHFKTENGKDTLVLNSEYYVNPNSKPDLGINPKHVRLSNDSSMIRRIIPYVGMTYENPAPHLKAVLHESYHSGTLALSNSFKEFCFQAKERNIPIFLTGLSRDEAFYETVSSYKGLGIIPLNESAVIAQYCKLWLAISNDLPLIETMQTSIAQDFI